MTTTREREQYLYLCLYSTADRDDARESTHARTTSNHIRSLRHPRTALPFYRAFHQMLSHPRAPSRHESRTVDEPSSTLA